MHTTPCASVSNFVTFSRGGSTRYMRDVVYAIRSFRKAPVFCAVAVLSLALGIGANTAIFTLIDQLILRLLPVQNPQEIVLLAGRGRPLRRQQRQQRPGLSDVPGHPRPQPGLQRDYVPLSAGHGVGIDGQTEVVNGELVSGITSLCSDFALPPAAFSPPPTICGPAASLRGPQLRITGRPASTAIHASLARPSASTITR